MSTSQTVLLPAETGKNTLTKPSDGHDDQTRLEDHLAKTALNFFIYHSGYVKRTPASAILYPVFENAFRSWLDQENVEFDFDAQMLHRIIEKFGFKLTYRGSDNPVNGETGLAVLGLEVDVEIVEETEDDDEDDEEEEEDLSTDDDVEHE